MNNTETLLSETASTLGSVLSIIRIGSRFGFAIAVASSFIASLAGFITNGLCSKLILKQKQLRDWLKTTAIVYEKYWGKSMVV